MRIECEQPITHAARSSKLSVSESQYVNQTVGIDVVKIVPGSNVGALSPKERGKVRVLAVEVDDVGVEASLLQQIRASREVRDPRLCLLGPRLVAVEPLTERSEGEAGLFVEQGLMD